jgi:predicted RNase H-like HicB family nuclease
MHKFLIIIEKANDNYSAYSPDLPGCVATGESQEEAERNMYEAIELHLDGMKEDNIPIPESSSSAQYVVIR